MLTLTTKSRYGTRMLLDIALFGKNGPVPIKDIAERQNISPKYLEKLIRDLRGAGYIKSKRGPKGGHMLTRPANAISVGEIVQVLEGEPTLEGCLTEEGACRRVCDCVTGSIWIKAQQAMYDHLKTITLSDLERDARRCPMLLIGTPGDVL
ncbi:MAG: Rrf2 family transcriptional regulator [Desulfovibrionaceae bacterium]